MYADVGGLSLVELCLSNLLELFQRVIIVVKDARKLSVRQDECVRIVCDGSSVYAAMVGMAAGLRASDRQLNYIVGCDMPLVVPGLIRKLHVLASGRDCALRCSEDGTPQPLGGFYSKSCLSLMDQLVASGDYRLRCLSERSDTALLPYQQVVELDPLLRSFCNVNTPVDISRLYCSSAC
jgi:molybdopterin-guanine dinucleotide biosynthesis protein A